MSLTSSATTSALPCNYTQFSQSLLTVDNEFFEESELECAAAFEVCVTLRAFLFRWCFFNIYSICFLSISCILPTLFIKPIDVAPFPPFFLVKILFGDVKEFCSTTGIDKTTLSFKAGEEKAVPPSHIGILESQSRLQGKVPLCLKGPSLFCYCSIHSGPLTELHFGCVNVCLSASGHKSWTH